MTRLNEVTELWGAADIIEDEPRCEDHHFVVYEPMVRFGEQQADPWGLFDRDGRLIPDAAYRREGKLAVQVEQRDVRASELDDVDGNFVYVGPIITHYGHFIIASLARLWAVRQNMGPDTRLLCHAAYPVQVCFQLPYVAAIMAGMGLQEADFVSFDRPVLLQHVRVPAPAMEEQGFAHRILDGLGAAVGRHYGLHERQRDGRPIYLSKTRLSHGISRFDQEAAIEQACTARGVEIVHPQDLSFADQLRALWSARSIAATMSSALHTTLFLPGSSRILGLAPTNILISNFRMMDRLKGNQSRYVHPVAPPALQQNDTFHTTWQAAEMPLVAAEFADLIDGA